MNQRRLLAFVHVEKAAGTTLNHILRRNFLFQHVDVRPLYRESSPFFRPRDLARVLRLVPFLRSIAGHSVTPFCNLEDVIKTIDYITLLRDPIKRYISHYEYWLRELNKNISFENYLKLDSSRDWQTHKISKEGNVEDAIEVLSSRFFAVGCVDRFDEFLIILRKKLDPFLPFNALYISRNVAKQRPKTDYSRYMDAIIENNHKDILLYKYIVDILVEKQIEAYGEHFHEDLRTFVAGNARATSHISARPYLDYLYRKAYIEPVTGYMRRIQGMPAFGSY